MSPEQAHGLTVDHRSDIYSLGIVLYELIAGHVPFEAETTWGIIFKHINEPPPPIPGILPPVQNVIDRALAKDPDARYQTCRELAADYMDAIGMVSEANVRANGNIASRHTPAGACHRLRPTGSTRGGPHGSGQPCYSFTGLLFLALAIWGFLTFFRQTWSHYRRGRSSVYCVFRMEPRPRIKSRFPHRAWRLLRRGASMKPG